MAQKPSVIANIRCSLPHFSRKNAHFGVERVARRPSERNHLTNVPQGIGNGAIQHIPKREFRLRIAVDKNDVAIFQFAARLLEQVARRFQIFQSHFSLRKLGFFFRAFRMMEESPKMWSMVSSLVRASGVGRNAKSSGRSPSVAQ